MFDFRPLTKRDLSLLSEWLQRPHVSEWWHAEDAFDFDEPSDAQPYIAFLDDRPVAFIQSYPAIDTGTGWWVDQNDPGVVGVDQFIGDPADIGHGLGTALVREFTELLFENPDVQRIQVDPSPENLRAIRCYEKSGFRFVARITTPDGAAHLMTLSRRATSDRDSSASAERAP